MSKVVYIFSHPVLFRVWPKAKEILQGENIELVVVSQMAPVNWNIFADEVLADADAVYINLTRQLPGFEKILSAAKNKAVAVPEGMEAAAAFPEYDKELSETVSAYIKVGQPVELANSVKLLLHKSGKYPILPPPPGAPLLCGIYEPDTGDIFSSFNDFISRTEKENSKKMPITVVCFGRNLWLDYDLKMIDMSANALRKKGFLAVMVFCDWELATKLSKGRNHPIQEILDGCGKRLAAIWNLLFSHTVEGLESGGPFDRYNVPVFQTIRNYAQTPEEWRDSSDGLSPMTICYSLIQPEMLGCIEPTILAEAAPIEDCIERLAERTHSWNKLQTIPNEDKRVAIILHNAPCKGVEGTIASAAGLDAAESTVRLLRRLKDEGYSVKDIPKDGNDLIERILERKALCEFRWTNTHEIAAKGGALAHIDRGTYEEDFNKIPKSAQSAVNRAWGDFPGEAMVYKDKSDAPTLLVTGLRFGNILVMVEPKRGCWGPKCDGEVCRILHEPDIPPPHHWLATYWYIQREADAIVNMGADGATEYLPGKRAGLSSACFPEITLGTLPNIYPYLMNCTGEGLMAKRRGSAVLIDHLSAPVRQLGEFDKRWDEMEELHRQYKAAETVSDMGRMEQIFIRLKKIMEDTALLAPDASDEVFHKCLEELPRRVENIRKRSAAFAQHILGENPNDDKMEMYVKEAQRQHSINEAALKETLYKTKDEMNSLLNALSGRFVCAGPSGHLSNGKIEVLPTGRNFYGIDLHAVPTEAAYEVGRQMGEMVLNKYLDEEKYFPEHIGITLWSSDIFRADGELVSQILWLLGCRPKWQPGGRVNGIEVLPCEELIMKNIDGEIIPRPRIDVNIQMSGIVRDTLPNMYIMIDEAVAKVSVLDEPENVNFVSAHVKSRMAELQDTMEDTEFPIIQRLASLRIFSSKPGSYGVGVNLAIDASAWKDDKDLAETFINWTGYGYGKGISGKSNVKATLKEYAHLMSKTDIAFQKAAAPEYDAMSITCYSGFLGGMSAAKRGVSGKSLKMYWGDSVTASKPDMRDLAEEIELSLPTKLLNKEWIAMRKNEGYRGPQAVAGMVNTLFSWSASARVVTKEQYDAVCQTYIENEENRKWLAENNVYALEEITRRLLEASSRELWQADENKLAALHEATLEIEGNIEEKMGTVKGEFQGGSVDIKTKEQVEKWKFDFTIE